MTNEIEDYIQSRQLSDQTKTTYKNTYKRLTEKIGYDSPTWLTDMGQETIIKHLTSLYDNVNTRRNILNLPIVLKQFSNRQIDKLLKERDNLSIKIEKHNDESKSNKLETLPSFSEITKYINNLYKDGHYREYIINYLIWKFCLRNKDSDLKIVTPEQYKQENNNIDNYIVKWKRHAKIIINSYKTQNRYGTKEFSVINQKFYKALSEIKTNWLLVSTNGSHLAYSSIGNYIKSVLYKGCGESDYMKINIKNASENKSCLHNLQKISANRGTSVDVILSNYNIKCDN